MNKKCCCFKCEQRSLGCHAKCERYKAYQAEQEEIKKYNWEHFGWDSSVASDLKKRYEIKHKRVK